MCYFQHHTVNATWPDATRIQNIPTCVNFLISAIKVE